MPSAFNVTTPDNDLKLEDSRRGTVALTVSNVSAKPQQGRLSLVPLDPTKAEWLGVAGAATRTFPVGGSEQFVVQIAVPKEAPDGRYTYRPDVVAVANPDEDSTQGPTLAFEVPKVVVVEDPWWKKYLWYIVAGAVVLLVVIGVVVFLLTRPRPAVVHASGTLSIPQTFQADLDAGTVGGGGTPDIFFEALTATLRFLVPQNGAALAIVATGSVDKSVCTAAPLSTANVPIGSLVAGTHVCVRTSEGRFSELTVISPAGPSPGTLVVQFTTWD
jgi:hypothetical protein